jgi:16S rRNA (guanine966-N2)-methyltransferase
MRVIAGKVKGKSLYSPRNQFIRPTSDMVKKAIFDYIGQRIENAVVLDLFSGSGNLAIEALSRGAHDAVLVDNSREAIRLILKNVTHTQLASQCQIIRQDVFRYLKIAAKKNQHFDFIFADPPYGFDDYSGLIEATANGNILTAGGLFILEHRSHQKIDPLENWFQLETTRIFGDTAISVFR